MEEAQRTPRFAGRQDADRIIERAGDFVLRHKIAYWKSMGLAFAVSSCAVLLQSVALGRTGGDADGLIYASMAVTALLACHCCLSIRRFFMAAKRAEFQSMVFASGMNMHAQFSMIVNREKNVVYSDKRAVEMFGGKPVERFDQIACCEGMSEIARKSLIEAVERRKNVQIALCGKNEAGRIREMTVTVDPLRRPDGYCLVRGF
jgi:hypothetical protein